jgi:hypothetical protein
LVRGATLCTASIVAPEIVFVRRQLVLTAPSVVAKGAFVEVAYELRLESGQSCSLLVLAADRQDNAELGAFRFDTGTRVIRGSVRTRIDQDQNISASAILSNNQIPTARIAVRVVSAFS